MKQLTQKQKETLAAKANETRIIGDYKGLWLYVEELLNGEPNAPVVAPKVPVTPVPVTSSTSTTATPSATEKKANEN